MLVYYECFVSGLILFDIAVHEMKASTLAAYFLIGISTRQLFIVYECGMFVLYCCCIYCEIKLFKL